MKKYTIGKISKIISENMNKSEFCSEELCIAYNPNGTCDLEFVFDNGVDKTDCMKALRKIIEVYDEKD